jgi:hypothetical protein
MEAGNADKTDLGGIGEATVAPRRNFHGSPKSSSLVGQNGATIESATVATARREFPGAPQNEDRRLEIHSRKVEGVGRSQQPS